MPHQKINSTRLIDLTGKRFVRFFVLGRASSGNLGQPRWLCVCDCGTQRAVEGRSLRSGNTKSCGCLSRERAATLLRTHGGTGTRTHCAWRNMKSRCYIPSTTNFAYYGGRGILVCDRWRNSFENFLADMGEVPEGLSLDRIDPSGNYEPGNCRWATVITQAQNKNPRVSWRTRALVAERELATIRRLAEKKGSPRIDHEDVMCFERILL